MCLGPFFLPVQGIGKIVLRRCIRYFFFQCGFILCFSQVILLLPVVRISLANSRSNRLGPLKKPALKAVQEITATTSYPHFFTFWKEQLNY
jgi:hypothetical protein